MKKNEKNGLNFEKYTGLMFSYDEANHLVTEDKIKPVISFNAQLFSMNIIEHNSATSSTNILKYKKANSKEYWANMKFLSENDYKERLEAISEMGKKYNYKIHCNDMLDGKMLYLLSQQSLYNRKYSPYLLCQCQRPMSQKQKS